MVRSLVSAYRQILLILLYPLSTLRNSVLCKIKYQFFPLDRYNPGEESTKRGSLMNTLKSSTQKIFKTLMNGSWKFLKLCIRWIFHNNHRMCAILGDINWIFNCSMGIGNQSETMMKPVLWKSSLTARIPIGSWWSKVIFSWSFCPLTILNLLVIYFRYNQRWV